MNDPTPDTRHLTPERRKLLETTVLRAREVAEAGARAVIEGLAVDRREPFSDMYPDARALRVRLRARARQLGDKLPSQHPTPDTRHLIAEVAYEHWHRMLFARFLAENNVLMHPDGVPVTLEECEELAPEEGAADGWELASWYAERMLPQIFRPGSPVFELKIPPEKVRELERLLADLPPDVFTASDSLGWVYQFWQAKKKDEVNKSEVKIGADELPAVTQLFTEPYMVQFLLHNTLGAWWVGRRGRDSLPVEMPYLRFLDDGTPAAGTFDGWPKTAAELKLLDPCCGSGHFLVAAFEILVRFRMAEEELSPTEACAAVLSDNLHGLEIDERCTQIAAFALALVAWTFPGAGGYRVLPEMHIACSGLAPRAKKDEWLALAGTDVRLRNGMERLHELFQDASELGSLINPRSVGMNGRQQQIDVARFDELKHLAENALAAESSYLTGERREIGIAARGIVAAASLLGGEYDLVVTNVPFLTSGKQADTLKAFCRQRYFDGRYDIGACFIERIVESLRTHGTAAAVTPHNWLFLGSYQALRRKLLRGASWHLVANLGARAFETIGGEVVGVGLVVFSNTESRGQTISGVEASEAEDPTSKSAQLRDGTILSVSQEVLLKMRDARITFVERSEHALLSEFVDCHQGLATGDLPRFGAFFWEVPPLGEDWLPWQSTVRESIEYGGRSKAIFWERGEGSLHAFNEAHKAVRKNTHLRGTHVLGRRGVVITQVGDLPVTLYTGEHYDDNTTVMVPKDASMLPALWAYLSSAEYAKDIRARDASLKVPAHTLAKVPFDEARWVSIAEDQYPSGLPEPHSDDPLQWLFSGSVDRPIASLQVAVFRLLGYRWPEQVDDGLDDLIDDDGIVCIPAVRGEQPAAVRLQRVLAHAFGDDWSAHKQAELLEATGCKGWTLDRWLSEKFFQQHCNVFQQRPFIWHIWDGLKKGGFGALVNYHKLNRNLLETLAYNYVGDWIRRQQDDEKRGVDGAGDRLIAAKALQDKLKLILKGEPPCDIFVRWKPIEQQPMGWEPDINDGVRLNIRPFMMVGDVGKRGAGILRDKPNIKWNKDRGADPSDAPWYELGPKYGGKKGDRINEHHLTLAEKQAARGKGGE